MKYIDIHCHLDFPDYASEIDSVLKRMQENQVSAISIGCDIKSSSQAVKIAEKNKNIWACIGVHPVDSEEKIRGGFDEKEFEKLVISPKVVAIGECGLDWFRMNPILESEKLRQVRLFEQQIEFALKHNKPLMLHCRKSYSDVLDILENYKKKYGDKLRGNSHFFAGSIEEAQRFFDIGFSISFTGVITFTHDYDELIKYTPKNMIMSETDAPFVSPIPYRGKRNEPSYVVEVVKRISELKDLSLEETSIIIKENAKKMFIL